ncbi:DegT/DnrJ/EryC1/StrS family aminotransferase [Halomonas organivorans]
MIPVSLPYLPDQKKYTRYVRKIYDTHRLTNDGPLVNELSVRLKEHLGVSNIVLVANGTLALQIAYQVVGLSTPGKTSEVVTSPFSFVATSSSLAWQGIRCVYTDIDPDTWCLNPSQIDDGVTNLTRGIVPVHVFGNGCDIDKIRGVARKHGLKVVYDAAHAFDVKFQGHSILLEGDASVLSFHATKLFHTIEGGAIVFREGEHAEHAKSLINFGDVTRGDRSLMGINAKMNEFQAAMGLCVLDDFHTIVERRKEIVAMYQDELQDVCLFQRRNPSCTGNYSYFPVLMETEARLIDGIKQLELAGYGARRYFHPSLDKWIENSRMVSARVSHDISSRIMCLPLFPGLAETDVKKICRICKMAQR